MSTVCHDAARAWVHPLITRFVPANTRRYSLSYYTGPSASTNAFGMLVDPAPAVGQIVAANEEWVLCKIARTRFLVCARSLLDLVPPVGSTARITFYAHRGFDGQRLDAPIEQRHDGHVIRTIVIGGRKAALPIERSALRSKRLQYMIEQVESLLAGDGVRRLAHVLVDAGAHLAPIDFVDPVSELETEPAPMLRFRVRTAKADGWLELSCDVALDTYALRLVDGEGRVLQQQTLERFPTLPELVVEWIDDGTWRRARVEILKAPRREAAGATG